MRPLIQSSKAILKSWSLSLDWLELPRIPPTSAPAAAPLPAFPPTAEPNKKN